MARDDHEVCMRIVLHRGQPYIESRVRPAGEDTESRFVPKGKVLVMRTPLLTDDGGESDEQELIDDDGGEAFCPECAAGGHGVAAPAPVRFRGAGKLGRNDPCRCGSGRKYKRCCLN